MNTERYAPVEVTLHLHPAFVSMLRQESDKAFLEKVRQDVDIALPAQDQPENPKSSLLQLADMALSEIKVTLHLHPAFVSMLQQETEKASLAQNQFTIYPSSLLQLATMVLGELGVEKDAS